jgi:hypothetical protein
MCYCFRSSVTVLGNRTVHRMKKKTWCDFRINFTLNWPFQHARIRWVRRDNTHTHARCVLTAFYTITLLYTFLGWRHCFVDELSGSHGDKYEYRCLTECCATHSGRYWTHVSEMLSVSIIRTIATSQKAAFFILVSCFFIDACNDA